MVNKVYDNSNKVSYLQNNKECYNLEITFQKWTFLSKLDLSEATHCYTSYTTFQNPAPETLK